MRGEPAPGPRATLTGPSRTIIVEPLEAPEEAPAPVEEPLPEREKEPEREPEKTPA